MAPIRKPRGGRFDPGQNKRPLLNLQFIIKNECFREVDVLVVKRALLFNLERAPQSAYFKGESNNECLYASGNLIC